MARGVSSLAGVSDETLAQWFPDGRRKVSESYETPDFKAVYTAMRASRNFTLLMAWRRYADAGGAGVKRRYGYAQFCALFADYVRTNDLVATIRHEPGRTMMVDWAGDTMDVVDTVTGEITKVYLFVAALPFSGVVFARGYADMKSPSWLNAHIRALESFGGVSAIVVPDNPTTSTHQRTRGDGERVVNARYQALADHYGFSVVPAGVRKPRHKAAAESAVNVVNKRVIGYLESETWTTVGDLNEAIAERVAEINHDLRRADGSTRWEVFNADERPMLAALPQVRFEEVTWKEAKAARNYHITCDYQRYSVPYRLAGKMLRVRLTAGTLTVFDGETIVCEHRRLTGRKGQYSTLPEHVPPQHKDIHGLWSRSWFVSRASDFGPATVTVIEQVLDRHAIEAQGYLDCQNILEHLGKRNTARLEAACQELLNRGAVATYTTIKRIMAAITSDTKAPQPHRPVPQATPMLTREPGPDVFVREASHYDDGQGA